jgi:hypothetical protein
LGGQQGIYLNNSEMHLINRAVNSEAQCVGVRAERENIERSWLVRSVMKIAETKLHF